MKIIIVNPDGDTRSRESLDEVCHGEAAPDDDPPSPDVRLQPEDLSVGTKLRDKPESARINGPAKTPAPELKLSVRKLLGCSPSPPPPPRPSPSPSPSLSSASTSDRCQSPDGNGADISRAEPQPQRHHHAPRSSQASTVQEENTKGR